MTQEIKRNFWWRVGYTDMLNACPDDVIAPLVRAMINYGTYGIEPEFEPELEWPLAAMFEIAKWDIDHPEEFDEMGNIIDDLAEEE